MEYCPTGLVWVAVVDQVAVPAVTVPKASLPLKPVIAPLRVGKALPWIILVGVAV